MARKGITLGKVLGRGIRRKCPCCGEASAFKGYLTVVDTCPVCQTPLSLYPTDDGPAYVTMILVGHLVIAPTFLFPFVWHYPLQFVVPVLVVALGLLTLVALPFVKGAFLSLIWYLGLKQAR
ncbi:DUF983 domain-containing protein [Asticcacaulis sp. EMRT-3]|uniref:DUF983 domain-containing protein n=1 Tax=Asticcacaulis sp. EMRT-3 TaxID=3040349 RepID=UPI0024AE8B88|nr:DUF983 domain-containing protein [Asticcacaulis sp. EMRT-3]MDI7773770.1 DUF983 domain-containing protein [Asticcacaulis sp. EMRT-3]